MKLIKHKNVESYSYFKMVISEKEMIIFEGAIDYVLKNCKEEELLELVGCETKEELKYFYEQILTPLLRYAPKEHIPQRLKNERS